MATATKPLKRKTKAQRQTQKARSTQLARRANVKNPVTAPRRPTVEPVGLVEIASQLGVKVDTVQHWRIRHDDFPAPRGTVSGTPWWHLPDVERWARSNGRG